MYITNLTLADYRYTTYSFSQLQSLLQLELALVFRSHYGLTIVISSLRL